MKWQSGQQPARRFGQVPINKNTINNINYFTLQNNLKKIFIKCLVLSKFISRKSNFTKNKDKYILYYYIMFLT